MQEFDVEETNRSLSNGKYGAGNSARIYVAYDTGEYRDDNHNLPEFDMHETNSDLALCKGSVRKNSPEEKFIYTTVQ